VRVRQHVNPLGIRYEEFQGDRPQLCPGVLVEAEIGCAEAQFLFGRAALEPDRTYLGLEVRKHLVDAVNARARREGLPVQAIFCNVNRHLRLVLPRASVDRAYLNFPDPWFKRRHRKRRIVDRQFALDLHWVLKCSGEVFLQTDVWSVALDAMEIFERFDDRYRNLAGAWSFWKTGNPYGVKSWREEHCEEVGQRIWRLLYRAVSC
jgi:tRNA (guanine-N7-)-methyltransferase